MKKIISKKILRFYICADLMMNGGVFRRSIMMRLKNLIIPDYIMLFLKAMRKTNYYKNNKGIINKILAVYYNYIFKSLGVKLGFTIGEEVFGYGLVIPHYGTIVVGRLNDIGNYAVLHTSTCISSNGKIIGDGLYLSTGVKITSRINLGNNISIGANSVVNKSFNEDNIMIAGAPAKYIKEKKPWYTLDSLYYGRMEAVERLKEKYNII